MRCKIIPACLSAALLAATVHQLVAQQAAANAVPEIAGLPAGARAAAEGIDPEKIRAHVRFLSLDLLEGRGPGTRGGELAAEYIATQFALAGVEPAGDDGTYFQQVPLYAVHTVRGEDEVQLCWRGRQDGRSGIRDGDRVEGSDRAGDGGHRCADRVCGIRDRRAGVQLERLRGR